VVMAAAVEDTAEAAAVAEEHRAVSGVSNAAPETGCSMSIDACKGGCGDGFNERDSEIK